MDISSNLNNQLLLLFTEIINNRPDAQGVEREGVVGQGDSEGVVDHSNNYYIASYFGHINPNLDLSGTWTGSGSWDGSDFSGNEYQYFDTINIPLDRRIRFRNNFLNSLNTGIDMTNLMTNNELLINNFIDRTLDTAKPVYKKIASEAGLRQIDEVVYHEDEFSQNMCPIYCSSFSDGETVCRLPCNHIFSKDGIYKWLQESHVCPVCRFCLECVEVKDENQEQHGNQEDQRDNEMTGINYQEAEQQNTGGLGPIQNIVSPFNLVNVLLQQGERLRQLERLEEMEYQEAIMRSLNET